MEEISKIEGCTVYPKADLTSYTTMRLTSRADLIVVTSVPGLQKLLPLLSSHHRSYIVVGWGANMILPPAPDALVIHLELPFDSSYLETYREEYRLPASLGLNHLTSLAVRFGLKGWEVFTGIPASLGGAVFMNAGTNLGEIGSLVSQVELVTPKGDVRVEHVGSDSFSYRKNHFVKPGEVIVGAVMVHQGRDTETAPMIKNYLEYRKRTQPLTTRNCGCVFKNPLKELPAGKLIDTLGLKGLSLGGLRVSPKHGNFIENTGHSDWDQFRDLLSVIQQQMDHFYGIEFELEVKIPYH